MLILGRKPDEAIIIGDGIRIVVLSCDRQGVRLGIEAPPNVTILREEIVASISEENRRAADGTTNADWAALAPPRQPPPDENQGTDEPDDTAGSRRSCD